jgi:hypothetical protein
MNKIIENDLLKIINKKPLKKDIRLLEKEFEYNENELDIIDIQIGCSNKDDEIDIITELLKSKIPQVYLDAFIDNCWDNLSYLETLDKRFKLESYLKEVNNAEKDM